jgi:hypothetical protein
MGWWATRPGTKEREAATRMLYRLVVLFAFVSAGAVCAQMIPMMSTLDEWRWNGALTGAVIALVLDRCFRSRDDRRRWVGHSGNVIPIDRACQRDSA